MVIPSRQQLKRSQTTTRHAGTERSTSTPARSIILNLFSLSPTTQRKRDEGSMLKQAMKNSTVHPVHTQLFENAAFIDTRMAEGTYRLQQGSKAATAIADGTAGQTTRSLVRPTKPAQELAEIHRIQPKPQLMPP